MKENYDLLDVILADERSYELKVGDILQVIIILRDSGLLNTNKG